jgi:plasmid stabilization system protein ParE
MGFDWQFILPSEAPATDCVYEERVRDDIRAIALSAVNEARREHILSAIGRDKSLKEAKREAEREVQRIAKKAEDLGCTPALAKYVDTLERRIEYVFEHMASSCENA